MFLTQTIVVDVAQGSVFEDVNEKGEKEFIQTDFDAKIAEFGELVEKEGGQVVSIIMSTTPEKLVAFITYADKELISKMRNMIQPGTGIPNLKLV